MPHCCVRAQTGQRCAATAAMQGSDGITSYTKSGGTPKATRQFTCTFKAQQLLITEKKNLLP